MGWFSRKVDAVAVTLIDNATGATFAQSQVPPENLPETFARDTTMHLGDEDWSVMHADPQTRTEYSKSGKLTLRLRRLEWVDPKSLLYSLPSIRDRLPAVAEAGLAGSELHSVLSLRSHV